MKRLIFLIPMLLISLGLFAQEVLPPVPETPWEAIGQFSYLIGSFPGVVVLMLFFVPFILGILNIQGKFLKYLFTILAVGILVGAAFFFSFGYLYDSQWWTIPLNVAFLMLIQIGIFSWWVARDIMDKIYEKFNPWKPTE